MGFYFKKLNPEAIIPTRATPEAAGLDLYSIEDVVISAGERKLVKTGIAMEIPAHYQAEVRSRSGLALKHGVVVLNSPGTIDSDYRGEVGAILMNHSNADFVIKKGDRIAQLVLMTVCLYKFEEKDELAPSDRGTGGFGSTGR